MPAETKPVVRVLTVLHIRTVREDGTVAFTALGPDEVQALRDHFANEGRRE